MLNVRISPEGELYIMRPGGEKAGRCHLGQGTCSDDCVIFKEPAPRKKVIMVGCILAEKVIDERDSIVAEPQLSFVDEVGKIGGGK